MKVIGLAGWSGAGKTTLLTRVIPHLLGQGLRVSSGLRWALMHELRGAPEPRLPELLRKMSPVDLVIVEGFKSEPHRKIEVYRAANGKPMLFPDDPAIVGIATDAELKTTLPVVPLDDIPAIAAMMQRSALPVEDVLARSVTES